jgi:hypothetical protein
MRRHHNIPLFHNGGEGYGIFGGIKMSATTDKQFAAYVRRLIRNLEDAIKFSNTKGEEVLVREIENVIAELREDIAN